MDKYGFMNPSEWSNYKSITNYDKSTYTYSPHDSSKTHSYNEYQQWVDQKMQEMVHHQWVNKWSNSPVTFKKFARKQISLI